MSRLWAILEKEWAETLRNRLLLVTVFLMPALFIALPLVALYLIPTEPVDPSDVERYVELAPQLAGMSPHEVMQVVIVNQFVVFFLMMPSFIPMTVAAFSIIGEKQTRSLEPLLATPVSTKELLLGKAGAAVIPAVAVTWLAYAVFAVASSFVASPVVWQTIVQPLWILAMLVVGPLIAVFSVFVGVIVSSRVNDTRVAQQIGGVVVLPIAGVAVAQTAGVVLVSLTALAVVALVLLVADVVVLVVGTRLFQRDRILTEWK